MISLVVTLGLVAFILTFWYIYDNVRNAERNELLDKFSKFPVRAFPLVGHLWYCLGSSKHGTQLINEAWTRSVEAFVVWLGMVPVLNVVKLEDIEEVSKMSVNRNPHGLTEGTFEDGIISQRHEKWRKTKRLLTPAFGHVMLKLYLQTFSKQSEVLVDLLHQKAIEGEIFDLWPFLINAQIDIITENMMGIQSDCQRSRSNEYSEAILKVVKMMMNRLTNPLLYPNFVYNIYLYLTGLSHYVGKIHEYPKKKIHEALKNRNDATIQNGERTSISSTNDLDDAPRYLVDILVGKHMKDPHNMTEQQMSGEMIHLIAAGSETTAITICLTLLMYGIHQAEQEAVYQEIKRIIPEDRPITMEDLNQLECMEKTIKETSRILSVLPITQRTTEHVITLPSGKVIPKGTDIFIHLRGIHENPLYYPNPSKWNPKNFDTEAVESRPKNSFAPFGIGLRSCIASKYAMLSMKMQISNILRKYHVSTDIKIDQVVLEQDLLRRSRDGYPVKLQIRDM